MPARHPSLLRCMTFLSALVFGTLPAHAQTETVHMGFTPAEVVAFAKRSGWSAAPGTAESRQITIQLDEKNSVLLYLTDCDAQDRCRSGYLLDGFFSAGDSARYYEWNRHNHGAVAYWRTNVWLKRPLHLRGVTDTYLREVILTAWKPAAESPLRTVQGTTR